MFKKLAVLLVVLLVIVGCARSSSDNSGNGGNEPGLPPVNDSNSNDDYEFGDGEEPTFNEGEIDESTDTNKIITNIHYGLESKNFDEDLEKFSTSARALGGSIKSLQVSGNKADERYASSRTVQAVYLIPYDNLDEFNENFDGMSFTNQTMTSEDVSKDYRDNNLRIESLETQHARLLELITTAETLEAVVLLEERLSQVELEINYLKGVNLDIEDKSDNVTITISMREIADENRLSSETSLGAKVSEAFTQMVNGTIASFENLIVGIVYYLPIVIGIIVLSIIGIVTFRRHNKRRPLIMVDKESETSEKEE